MKVVKSIFFLILADHLILIFSQNDDIIADDELKSVLTHQNDTISQYEESNSYSSSGHISSLNFVSGLMIIGGSLLATVILMAVIRMSASYHERRMQNSSPRLSGVTFHGDERLQDESDAEELHGDPASNGIIRPHLSHIQGKTRSHDGAEFVKLKHYEGTSSPPSRKKHHRIQSV
jgi:hypothetical protein